MSLSWLYENKISDEHTILLLNYPGYLYISFEYRKKHISKYVCSTCMNLSSDILKMSHYNTLYPV